MTKGVAKSEWDAIPGGVAALARKPIPIQAVEPPLRPADLILEDEPDILGEGRLLHAAVPVGTGRTVLHMLTYYGFSGARAGNAVAKRLNEAGLSQAFRYVAALGNVPVVLGGDLNDNPESSRTLYNALQTGVWKGAALLEADKCLICFIKLFTILIFLPIFIFPG